MTGSDGGPPSLRFRARREAEWRRLEGLLDTLERGRASRLDDADLIALPVLYRAALSSLSVARATALDRNLVEYLEALALRGYFAVYGVRTGLGARLAAFFRRDWPLGTQALGWEIALAAVVQLGACLTAFLLVQNDALWFGAFIDPATAGGRGPDASTAALRAVLYAGDPSEALGNFASFLFTHNAQVAMLGFALGFALCLPTLLVAASNGAALGALLALYAGRGLAWELGGWLLIHGVSELLAMTIAFAAGLRLGRALAFPGRLSRLGALAAAGRTAATALAGVLVMLLCAGLLEGFGRQIVHDDAARYAIAGATALLWGAYLFAPRRR
jgi:uncharacterized membrane protein SpoIIM required for sporulation